MGAIKDAYKDYKIRKQIKKNADVEADTILNKLNRKNNDYYRTAYAADQNTGKGHFAGVKGKGKLALGTVTNILTAASKGGAAKANTAQMERVAKRAMRKQVRTTRKRQYDENQKRIAGQMGVKLDE